MTCKAKQNLRVQKACARKNKATYFKNFTPQQQRLLKLAFKKDRIDREIDMFWYRCRRDENSVPYQDERNNWDYFNMIFKEQGKLEKSIQKLTDKYNLDELQLRDLYNQYSAGCNSTSF
jgi:hypothetical protein